MACCGCLDPARRIKPSKIDRMSGSLGQQLEILKLCASVALAERMNEVDVADDHGNLRCKIRFRQTAQEPRPGKPTMNVRHAGVDVLAELKLLRAFADLDSADFASPWVDVLEQMAMDSLEMREIKRADRYAFRNALSNDESLNSIEDQRIGDVQAIL